MRRSTLPILLLAAAFLLGGCSATRYRMAIMDFDVSAAGPQYQKLRTAMPELLTQNLDRFRSIYLLERQDIETYLDDIDSEQSEKQRMTRWQKLGETSDADYLVAGSVIRLGQNFVLNVRLFNVERGEIAPGSSFTQSCIQETDIYERARTLSIGIDQYLRRRTLPTALDSAAKPAAPLSLPVANDAPGEEEAFPAPPRRSR
jgi:TolB-like protein